MAVGLAGCAKVVMVPQDANQPDIKSGTTVIAIAIVQGAGTSCRAKVSRELAYVRPGRPVVWEVLNLCTPDVKDVTLKFTEGELRKHLQPQRPNRPVGPKRSDYLQWNVGKGAQKGQYADYEIWLGNEKLADPRIQVP
jgi:hypothetical protein